MIVVVAAAVEAVAAKAETRRRMNIGLERKEKSIGAVQKSQEK